MCVCVYMYTLTNSLYSNAGSELEGPKTTLGALGVGVPSTLHYTTLLYTQNLYFIGTLNPLYPLDIRSAARHMPPECRKNPPASVRFFGSDIYIYTLLHALFKRTVLCHRLLCL